MIIYELDSKDCLIILNEKKSRIQGYQGFNNKEMPKLDERNSTQKSSQCKAVKKNVIK